MRVRDAMTPDVQLCTPEDTLRDAAEAMAAAKSRWTGTLVFIAQPAERIDYLGVYLDDAPLQLGDIVLVQLGQQFGGTRRESPCLQVDKMKLLLGAQRSRR